MMFNKKNHRILFMVVILLFMQSSPSDAFFGAPTIEDFMEWFGISRTDRTIDIKDNILEAFKLSEILPKEFSAANLNGLFRQFKDISNQVEKAKELYNQMYSLKDNAMKAITDLYKEELGLWDKLKGSVGFSNPLESMFSNGEGLLNSASNINWESYKKIPDNGIKTNYGKIQEAETDVYTAVKDMVDKQYGDKMTPGMKEFDATAFPGSGMIAYMGSMTMPKANRAEGMYKAAAEYGQKAKEGRIHHIQELIVSADIRAQNIRTKIEENRIRYAEQMSNLGGELFASSGAAWKSSAASYATVTSQNMDSQNTLNEIMELMRIRLRMKAQVSSLLLYDYVQYCYDTMIIRRIE